MKLLLVKISEKLKQGNGIFIIIPNWYSPARLFTSKWKNEKDELGHINLLPFNYLKKILRSLGFINLRSSFHYRIKKFPDYIKIPKLIRPIIIILYRLTLIYPFYYFKDSFFFICY
jgi:hypothetical protein